MGYDVTVLTFLSINRLRGLKPSDDEQVSVIRIPSSGFKHPVDQILTSLIGNVIVFLTRNPHWVIVSIPPGEPCIGSYTATSFFGKRLVVDVRDEWEDAVLRRTKRMATRMLYRFYRSLFTAIYQRSSIVTTVSPTLVERVRKRGAREAWLLPNGADIKLFHPSSPSQRKETRKTLGLNEHDFVFVYAGVVGWYYRIDVVIKALHKLVKEHKLSNIRLLIVGTGDKTEEYSKLAKQLELTENVQFIGEKPRHEVAKILPCCDVGVIPFDDDPIWMSAYTTKLFEYSASGLATIVSVIKGSDLEKLIMENKTGIYAEPMQIDQMAEAMLNAYDNKKKLKQMGLNARKLVVARFNRETTVREFVELLRARLEHFQY